MRWQEHWPGLEIARFDGLGRPWTWAKVFRGSNEQKLIRSETLRYAQFETLIIAFAHQCCPVHRLGMEEIKSSCKVLLGQPICWDITTKSS